MMRNKLSCLVLSIVVLGLCGPARSDDFSWLCENDAKIDKNNGDANYGQSGGECHPGMDRTAFLMSWDFSSLAGWNAASDGTLTIPHVYWRQDGTGAALYALAGGPFAEDTVTYNSYVGIDNSLPTVLGELLDTNNGDQRVTFTVPQATIQGLIDGTIDGLALSNPPGGYWNHCFNSGEGAGQEPFLSFSASAAAPALASVTVDDMESYGSADTPGAPGSRIWYTWRDGEGWLAPPPAVAGNGTGSVIDVSGGPVHEGMQSLMYDYDNDGTNLLGTSGKMFYSEVTASIADLPIGANWTEAGADVNQLGLYFYGQATNDNTEQMYIVLEDGDTPKHSKRVVYHGDANDVQKERWQPWRIPLADFNDVNLANVATMTIGFGDPNATTAGGKGTVYFDNILLLDPNRFEESKGPIVWYKLEDGSGNTAVDAMGNYNAVLRNPIWLADNGFDGSGCLEFDDNQALSIPRGLIVNHVTTAVTFALWVRWDDVLPGAGWQPLISMNNQTKMRILCPTPQPQIQFFVGTATEPLADGVAWGDGAAIRQLAGVWNHWAFTKNCVTGEQSIYCNGQRVAHNAAAQKVATIPVPEDTDTTESWRGKGLNFGGREAYHGFWGQGDGNGKGQLDDIRIYNYALSDSEVADVVAGATGGP